MKKNTAKWVRAALLVIWTAFLLNLTWTGAKMTKYAYSDWMANRGNVQERLYEAVYMFFAYAQMLVFEAALLFFSIRRLILTVRQPKGPGRITRWIRQKGIYLAIGFTGLFILLVLPDIAAHWRILHTVETNEAPAAIHDYLLSGKLEIGAELAAIGAVTSFVSWRRGRKGAKPERANAP